MKKAIKKAIEGGYEGLTINDVETENYQWQVIVCDLDFWQALGKAEGWPNHYHVRRGKGWVPCDKRDATEQPIRTGWVHEWHRFIDHLAEGKSADDFFTNLLK